MAKYVLDCDKWRCGGNSHIHSSRLGIGSTRLLNEEGFMCCLGQVSVQIDPEAKIFGRACPDECFNSPNILIGEVSNKFSNTKTKTLTPLSVECLKINDNTGTTVAKKIELLKAVFAKEGHELEVINYNGN